MDSWLLNISPELWFLSSPYKTWYPWFHTVWPIVLFKLHVLSVLLMMCQCAYVPQWTQNEFNMLKIHQSVSDHLKVSLETFFLENVSLQWIITTLSWKFKGSLVLWCGQFWNLVGFLDFFIIEYLETKQLSTDVDSSTNTKKNLIITSLSMLYKLLIPVV